MTALNVQVPPDDFSVVVEEDTQSAPVATEETLVDENGTVLVDENDEVLTAIDLHTGAVFVVQVQPDDFSVIVEEDTP